MPYIAKKHARFDREYSIGEKIPDAVVDTRRAQSLIDMGRIIYIDEPEQKPEHESAQEAQEEPSSGDRVETPGAEETAAGEQETDHEQPKKAKGKK